MPKLSEETKAKREAMQKIAKVDTDSIESGVVTFTFAHDGAVLVLSYDAIPDAMRVYAAMDRVTDKVRDSYAGAKPEEALGLAQKAWDTVLSGKWIGRKEAGEPREEPTDVLARALVAGSIVENKANAAIHVYEFAEAKALLEGMDRKGRSAVKAIPSVAKALVDIKAEAKPASLAAFQGLPATA